MRCDFLSSSAELVPQLLGEVFLSYGRSLEGLSESCPGRTGVDTPQPVTTHLSKAVILITKL